MSQSATTQQTDQRTVRRDQINAELKNLENSASAEYPEDDAAISSRIASNEGMIASVNLESSLQRATYADELQALRFRQAQEANIVQQRLTLLSEQIRRQEAIVANAYQSVTSLPESQGQIEAQGIYESGLGNLSALQAEYSRTLSVQENSPDFYFVEQSQRIDQMRSNQTELASLIFSAEQENRSLRQQQAERGKARSAREAKMRSLNAELSQLSASSAGASPVPGP